MTTEVFNGNTYEFPLGDAERKSEIYYMKKALAGDKVAQDLFMEGKPQKWIFIGKEYPIWVKLYLEDGKLKSAVHEVKG